MKPINKAIKEIKEICNKHKLTKKETELTMKSILLAIEYEKELE